MAKILLSDFDDAGIIESWLQDVAPHLDDHGKALARLALDRFIDGLKRQKLVFEAEHEIVLKHEFTFVCTFIEGYPDDSMIDAMADDYLAGEPNLDAIKNALHEECPILHSQLIAFNHLFGYRQVTMS